MGQNGFGGRPISKRQRNLICVLIFAVCLVCIQFWTYEQTGSSGLSRISELEKKIEAFKNQETTLLLQQALSACRWSLGGEQGSKEEEGAKVRSAECLIQLLSNSSSLQTTSLLLPPSPQFKSSVRKETEVAILGEMLKSSTVFLKLKDVREPEQRETGPTWFMSSVNGPENTGLAEELEFPSEISQGRLLCLKGTDTRDGTQNEYGFAWKDYLPPGSKLLPGLTLVADNYWDYTNIWHSMSALVSFVDWRRRHECVVPERVLLYHWGELVPRMCSWMENVLQAAIGRKLKVEKLDNGGRKGPVCLERAVLNRRGLGGISKQNMNILFDTVRCRARKFCGVVVASTSGSVIRVTLLLRSGPRAFRNETGLKGVLGDVCGKDANCRLEVSSVSNLSFCDQVALMSRTDVLVTAHGAQMTNALFMSKGGSVMELIPKGWLEFAGIGQHIYAWLADWANLKHEGVWHDPEGLDCPYPTEETLKCFLFYKDITIGLNETYMAEWTTKVLQQRRADIAQGRSESPANSCACDPVDHMESFPPLSITGQHS